MMFDEQARQALHTNVRARGYRGSLNQLMDELRAHSYGAEIRLFVSSAMSITLQDYPDAREFMGALCQKAQKRFDQVYTSTWNLCSESSIVFGHSKRRRRKQGSPLRLAGVTVTAEIRGGRAEVRVQAYIGNELRRDISRYFEPQQKQECGE
jgi:hypothetical protein